MDVMADHTHITHIAAPGDPQHLRPAGLPKLAARLRRMKKEKADRAPSLGTMKLIDQGRQYRMECSIWPSRQCCICCCIGPALELAA